VLVAAGAAMVWFYLPVSALSVDVGAPTRPVARAGLPWLSTDRAHIVDASGRTVLLRGFNDDALLEPGTVHPAPLDETDATMMQRSGFDSVRLPIAWSRLEPERGRFDTAYLEQIAAAVDLLNRHGMYVVLDMHFLDWSPRWGGSGAPRWAALPAVPDAQWWPWESWRRHLSPAVQAAYSYFWLAPDWQRDFQQAWQMVAQRFRDDSGVAGYDLYNEPHPLPLPPGLFEKHWMWPLYARTIAALAQVDRNHLFIVEGTLFADFPTTVVPLHVRDLVYSPHIYTGSLVPPAFTGDRRPLQRHIAEQAGEAAVVPAPMWPGELGIDHAQAGADQWADTVLDAYDDLGVGWSWWQWREDSGWAIRNAAGDHLDTDFLRHIARPYLVAAPRGISAGRGDGVTGTLHITVDAGHHAGEVVVGWPSLTLGAPRLVGTCLAASDWDAAGSRVTLTLQGAAGCTIAVAAGAA